MPNNARTLFRIAGFDTHVYLEKKKAQKICIFSEYLKRKFYLDCTMCKRDGEFIKNKQGKYEKLNFSSFSDLVDNIEDIFGFTIQSGNIFVTTETDIYNKIFEKQQCLYKTIIYLYKLGYKLFKYQIINTINNGVSIFGDDLIKENSSQTFSVTPYFYENIINYLSDYGNMSDVDTNCYRKLLYVCCYDMKMNINSGVYRIFHEIISKYYLYLRDLTDPINAEFMIDNNYRSYFLPLFYKLPNLQIDKHPLKNIIKSYPDPAKNILELSIDFSNLEINKIAEFAKDVITYYLYLYKSVQSISIDQDEYNYISKFLDAPNKSNSTSKFEERIDGLYIWDKLYINNSKLTMTNEIERFLRNKKNMEPDSSLIRKYQRIVEATTKCIENGMYLPLAAGGQPKPAAG